MRMTLVLLLLIGAVGSADAAAAQTASDETPDLVGVWTCDRAPVLFRDGEWTSVERRIDVVEQRGPIFNAINHWALPNENDVDGHQHGALSRSGSNTWIGVVDFDNRTFRATAFGDGHIIRGQIVEPDVIEISALESGDHAWVSRETCRRREQK